MKNNLDELSRIIAKLSSAEKIKTFLAEILTDNELEDVLKRWEILKMLQEGKSQRTISKAITVSLCKVTRGAKILKNNKSIIRKILFDESWRK